MIYLQLLPVAEFSYYGKDGCVFHLLNQKRFPCDEKVAALLDELLKGKAYVESEYEEDFNQYLSELMEEGMLYPYSNPVYHETYCSKSSMEIRGLFEEPPQMREIYIQGAKKCNYNCKYCKMNQKEEGVNYGCRSCIQWGDLDTGNTIDDRTRDIKRLMQLHHSKVTISGGNPFLAWKDTKRMINLILQESASTEIHIIHNGAMLSEEILYYLREHNIYMEIMVFGYDDISCFEVTGSKAAFKEWNELLKCLQKLHIDFELIPVGNGKNLDMIQRFIMDECYRPVHNIVEISETEQELRTVIPYSERMKLPLDEFFDRKRYNRCLYGKLALTMAGRIQPCPMLEDTLVDLREKKLEFIFQNQYIDRYWRMTRKEVSGCRQCPYQWLCSDCMKMVMRINQYKGGTEWFCKHMEEGGEENETVTSTVGHS